MLLYIDGKAYVIPECDCGRYMIPKEYETDKFKTWICPDCMKEITREGKDDH